MFLGGDDEDENENQEQESVIPGDNDKPSEEGQPSNKDAPDNLTKIPDSDKPLPEQLGGD